MEPGEGQGLTADSPLLYLHCEAKRLVRIVYQCDRVTNRIWQAVTIRFLDEHVPSMRCEGEQLMRVIVGLRPYAKAMGQQAELRVDQGQVRSAHETAH
jgi:hypothetical protein